jgi:ribonuclease HI
MISNFFLLSQVFTESGFIEREGDENFFFSKMIEIYTDGSCKENVGGYAFVILFPNNLEIHWSDSVHPTTNNRMELTAVIEALKTLLSTTTTKEEQQITIYSDSLWVINCAQNLWKRNKNLDLWEEYNSLSQKYNNIHFIKVKAHSGNFYNEICDKMAYNEISNLC